MAYLERTEYALETVRAFLREAPQDSSVVESYLVQYLAVCFYSEVEEHIKDILKTRLHFEGDKKLSNFVFKTNEGILRRVKKSEINDVLDYFGENSKELFEETITIGALRNYSNVITHRHNVSHKDGAKITLREIDAAVEATHSILSALEGSIK